METAGVLSELRAEHRALETQAAQLRWIVAAAVPDTAAVAGMRWRMAQALLDHSRREESTVYAPLLASADAMATGIAGRLHHGHGGLGPAFATYIAAWPVERISREWDRFRTETEALLADLTAQIRSEEDLLYPHAERVAEPRAAA